MRPGLLLYGTEVFTQINLVFLFPVGGARACAKFGVPILEAGPMVLWACEEQNRSGIANTWLTFLRWGDTALPSYHSSFSTSLLIPVTVQCFDFTHSHGCVQILQCGLSLNTHGYSRVFTASAFTGHLGNIFGGVPAQVSLFLCFLLVEFYAFYRHKPFICHTHYCAVINVSISCIQYYAISKSICYICCWYLFPCCAPPIAAFGYIDFLIFNLV